MAASVLMCQPHRDVHCYSCEEKILSKEKDEEKGDGKLLPDMRKSIDNVFNNCLTTSLFIHTIESFRDSEGRSFV